MIPTLDGGTEQLLRELSPQVLGVVMRRFRTFDAVEDAVQEALLAAALQWPREGRPENPRAWLIQVAARRFTDHIRAASARRERESLVVDLVPPDDRFALAPDEENLAERDDTLDLLFMCCHSALSPSSSIALTLRAVGGLSTLEIAKAFLVPEATMAQRISRAKQSIQASGVPFEPPSAVDRERHLGAVTHVLYLIFSEGYTASVGAELQRRDLSAEAMRLTRLLRRLVPDDGEVAGLLSLMLLTDARRAARSGPAGRLIPLDEQDRSLWDQDAIAEGTRLISETLPRGAVGPYQVQAAIAALHDEAASADATDWVQISALYTILLSLSDNPMVALSHAIAIAMVEGPDAGLARLGILGQDKRLAEHYRFFAVRAHLLERAGDIASAIADYRRAAQRTTSTAEQSYLLVHAARLAEAEP